MKMKGRKMQRVHSCLATNPTHPTRITQWAHTLPAARLRLTQHAIDEGGALATARDVVQSGVWIDAHDTPLTVTMRKGTHCVALDVEELTIITYWHNAQGDNHATLRRKNYHKCNLIRWFANRGLNIP